MSSFITTEATQDVFELVLARPVVTHTGEHSRLVHLWWLAPMQGDRLVQVYVCGELYDVTLDPTVRQMLLVLDRGRPQRIELLAVPADDPELIWRSQPGLLKAWQPAVSDYHEVALVRDADLPTETQVVVSVDGERAGHAPLWPATESTTGPGIGLGELGAGPLGNDGRAWCWRYDNPPAGEYALRFDAVDPSGQVAAEPLVLSAMVEHLTGPVTDVSMSPGFQLQWNPPETIE